MSSPRSRRYLGEVVSRRYMIDRLVGEGSFAWVYHARERSGEEVAVKILHSTQPTATVRFAREIVVLKSLPENPYVARYVDHGETREGRPLLVLEYVDGITLKQGLERRPKLAPQKSVAFLAELCQAFAGLHQLGVAHRDVKPENILLARRGGIKLIDFGLIRDAQGILKLLEEVQTIDSRVFSEELDRGVLAGTPEYMAPEQFSDSAVDDETDTKTDTHSDVFSLGVILHELLTGEKPFPMKEAPGQEYAKELLRYLRWRIHLRDEDLPGIPGIDPALRSIVRKALRRDPRRRQPDSRVLMDDLHRYLQTGEGVRDADESRTQIVAVERVLSSMRPSSGSAGAGPGSPASRAATPPARRTDEADQEDEEPSTASMPSLGRPPASGPPPAVRGHTKPFFVGSAEDDQLPADPLGVTARLHVPSRAEPPGVTAAPAPRSGPWIAGQEDSAERQDVVPTQMVQNEDAWPVENLADPPRSGEPEVFSAPTDVPSLGEDDLFELSDDDGELGDFDGFIEAYDETDSSEVNLAELAPREPKGRGPKR